MERKTTSKEEYYLKQQQLQEFGRVKSRAPLVSRLVDEHEKVANLTLSFSKNMKQQYSKLSKWEKLFVVNFYEGKPRPTGEDRMTKIQEDIENELARLYALADDEAYFEIDINDNPDLDREFESEIKALKQRGEGELAKRYEQNANKAKAEMAKKYASTLREEYKHIVDFIKSTSYESSFKALMLRETLLKTYKKTKDEDGEKTIVKSRVEHKTIVSHMTLNADVLNTIYNELDNYTSFPNLYFAGIAISNKTIAGKNSISLAGVDTFGKGRWMKFEGKQSNKDKYIKNAQELAALVQDTPWCTKNLASSQLEQGDFYVFVDNEGKPHIAVKMSGNTVDEVRGTKGGNAQELEEDYRDVAMEFLTKNPDVEDGDKWLKKEEWNARLIEYNHQIESGKADEIDIEELLQDYLDSSADYKTHGGYENSNKTALKENLPKLRPQLVKHFNCKPEEICCVDINFEGKNKQPYVIILRNARFEDSQITSLGNLQTICGDAYFRYSQIIDLGNLQSIGGYVDFAYSQMTNLGKLQSIGGSVDFYYAQITNLGNLQSIGGYAGFDFSQITNLGNLQSIGRDADFDNSNVICLGNLQTIGGDAYFRKSKMTSLGKLKIIGKCGYFENSQISSLGNLQTIGGDAYFKNSKITNFGNLQTIGGKVDFGNNKKLEELFYSQFEKDGNGWKRKLTAQVEQEKSTDKPQKKSRLKIILKKLTSKKQKEAQDIQEKSTTKQQDNL